MKKIFKNFIWLILKKKKTHLEELATYLKEKIFKNKEKTLNQIANLKSHFYYYKICANINHLKLKSYNNFNQNLKSWYL